jgi:hypothetical protein
MTGTQLCEPVAGLGNRLRERIGGGVGRRSLLVLAFYIALAALWFARAWIPEHGHARLLDGFGNPGDPVLFVWYLAWMRFALWHGHNPLFTHWLMAPHGANLMANTSILAPSFVMSPVTAVLGPVVSYNVLVTLAVAFSAWAAYLACRFITGSDTGAVICGLLYGFSAYMQSQSLSHLHIAIAVFPPFALAIVYELVVRQRYPPARVGALLGLGCFFQLMTAEEMLASTVLMASLLICVLAYLHRDEIRARWRHAARGLVAAAIVGLLLGGPFVAYTILGPQHEVLGRLRVPNRWVADLAGFVIPTHFESLSTPGLRHLSDGFSGFSGEFSVYLGIPLLLLTAVAAWRLRASSTAKAAAIMVVAAMVLSLGGRLEVLGHITRVPLPMLPAAHLPLLANILPDRLALFTNLAIGIVLALFVAELSRRSLSARAWALGGVALALVPLIPAGLAPAAPLTLPTFFSHRSREVIPQDATVLILPFTWDYEVPMAAQLKDGFRYRLAEGGVFTEEGWGPRSTGIFALLRNQATPGLEATCRGVPEQPMTDRCRSILASSLRARGVNAVVVVNGPGSAWIAALVTELYRRAPMTEGGVRVWVQSAAQPTVKNGPRLVSRDVQEGPALGVRSVGG